MTFIPLLIYVFAFSTPNPATLVREGSSPQLAMDSRGTIRMVFGRRDTIFAVASKDQGVTFGSVAIVGVVPKMHLGNTRGPTIASSRARSVVMAFDQAGNITTFQLDHATDRWTRHAGRLNDAPASAPEGLGTLAANQSGEFFATWLDLREGRQNQIYFGAVPLNGTKRSPNRLVYASRDGHVCECCRPGIAIAGRHTALMFRNWLDGARDMYAMVSSDRGRRFTTAQKLGEGTWKLDACPMDGGALAIDTNGVVSTVWRRENTVYYARPGAREEVIGNGRSPMISQGAKATFVVWQDGSSVKLTSPGSGRDEVVGEGRLPQVLALPDGRALVAWEKAGAVYYRRM